MIPKRVISMAVVHSLAVALSFMSPATTHADSSPVARQWRKDPVSSCSFIAPAALGTGPVYWIGACPGGKASGIGMLRRRDGRETGPAFYGELDAGVPRIGVVDDNSGYRAGMFVDGDIGQADLEPQVRLDAFDAAVRAARAVSAYFAAAKNKVSAQFYEKAAKTFEMQTE